MFCVFCSDLHGDFNYLRNVIDKFKNERVIQLGDLGIGFPGYPWPKEWSKNFSFIRGNHDSPDICRKHPNYLGDYGSIKEMDLFYLSGASSIDWNIRTAGIDWWSDEQLGTEELQSAVNDYVDSGARILIAHTAPHSVFDKLVAYPVIDRTSMALQTMVDQNPPDVFICGHFHKSIRFRKGKTNMIALDTKQVYRLDTETLKGSFELVI